MKDKKCNYCYTDADGYTECLPTPKYCRNIYIYKQNSSWSLHGGNDIKLEINYCPICGRKLDVYSKTI